MAKKKTSKFSKLSPEEAMKLKPFLDKLGLELKVIYENKCELCGKKFISKDKEKLEKKLVNHVDNECNEAKWIRGATNILEILGLKNVKMGDLYYIQFGKFPKDYKRTKPEEMNILNRAKDALNFER